MKNKKGILMSEILIYLLIALGVLILIIVLLFYSNKSGNSMLEHIKSLFRFGA